MLIKDGGEKRKMKKSLNQLFASYLFTENYSKHCNYYKKYRRIRDCLEYLDEISTRPENDVNLIMTMDGGGLDGS